MTQPGPSQKALQTVTDHIDAHEFDRAVALLEGLLQAHPKLATLHLLLGAAYHGQGALDLALNAFERATELDPGDPQGQLAKAAVLYQRGHEAGAVEATRRAIALQPDNPRGYVNLALLREANHPAEALDHLDRALSLDPEFADGWQNRGVLLAQIGRLEEALESYQQLAELSPANPNAFYNCADAAIGLSRFAEALQYADRCLAIMPDHPGGTLARGIALAATGDLELGQTLMSRAVGSDPTLLAHINRRSSSQTMITERDVDARSVFVHCQLDRLEQGDWRQWEAFIPRLQNLLERAGREDPPLVDRGLPFRLLALPIPARLRVRATAAVSDRIEADMREAAQFWVSSKSASIDPSASNPAAKLRVGYLTPDLGEHPNSYNIEPLLIHHSRDDFELYLYGLAPFDGSARASLMRQRADFFRDLSTLSDQDAAYHIFSDNLDVLVDTAGYTEGSRPEILALRPAPVQITYQGFHETMAASFIDYQVIDPDWCSDEERELRREQLIELPETSFSFNETQDIISLDARRAHHALPEHATVYSAFHQRFKLDPKMFNTWLDVLVADPGAVLWLLDYDENTNGNLRENAAHYGVDPRRLVFAAKVPRPAHLSRLGLADCALDAGYYGSHTTVFETLLAGVPLVTRMGSSLYGRIAGSLLRRFDLADLVTADDTEFVRTALRSVSDRHWRNDIDLRIAALRGHLSGASYRRAKGLECAFREVHQRYREGGEGRPVVVEIRDGSFQVAAR